jgi:hypothetical protein
MKHNANLISLFLLVFAGCIGTDFVDEPLGPVPARLELSHASLVLLEGESQQLSAQVIASDESVLDEPVIWRSRNLAVATVDVNGLLMTLGAGQVWIDVQSQSLADSLLVTVAVDPEALASIVITSGRMELSIGDTLQLEVELSNANGVRLTEKMVDWLSSRPDICSVDDEGLVTALANGNVVITATSEGLSSLPFPLMVGGDFLSRSGTFQGLNGYSVVGTATLERSADEAAIAFGDDFSSQNGPGLYVYLSSNANNVNGGVNLGKLKATSGTQSYPIPANVDPEDFEHVLVYCQPFGVPFGAAKLE